MSIQENVLQLLKELGPLSVNQVAQRLSLVEQQVRGGIDRVRKRGEPVWNNKSQELFWWADDYPIGNGWQRELPGSRGEAAGS